MDLETFFEKKKNQQLQEAISLANRIKKLKGRNPTCEEMKEYFWLFTKSECLTDSMCRQIQNLGESKAIFEEFYNLNRQKQFDSFEEFLDYCWRNEK